MQNWWPTSTTGIALPANQWSKNNGKTVTSQQLIQKGKLNQTKIGYSIHGIPSIKCRCISPAKQLMVHPWSLTCGCPEIWNACLQITAKWWISHLSNQMIGQKMKATQGQQTSVQFNNPNPNHCKNLKKLPKNGDAMRLGSLSMSHVCHPQTFDKPQVAMWVAMAMSQSQKIPGYKKWNPLISLPGIPNGNINCKGVSFIRRLRKASVGVH